MNQTILFALTANGRSFAENAKEAGTVTLLGMVSIFAVLALLWGVIEILHRLLGGSGKSSGQAETKKPAPAVPQEKPAAQPAAQQTDDGALIAAITAAISASLAEQGYTGGFRVVSFKRAPGRRTGRF